MTEIDEDIRSGLFEQAISLDCFVNRIWVQSIRIGCTIQVSIRVVEVGKWVVKPSPLVPSSEEADRP